MGCQGRGTPIRFIHYRETLYRQREVERHQCTIRRIEQLLADLGESLDGPEALE